MIKSVLVFVFSMFFISPAFAQVNSGFVKHSAITLMPEGEPDEISAFNPLHPSVVAWGMDAIHTGMDVESMKNKMDEYKEIGIEHLACNVWMLTATNRFLYQHPEYQKAVCVDIEQNPITPGWLDSEYRGIKSYWGCTNNPLYRKLLMERAEIGIKAGANMLHLDDHMGTAAAAIHSGGCFCSYCMKGFNFWLQKNYSSAELESMNIPNIQDFNYAQMVKDAGFSTLEKYNQGINRNQVPLHDKFLAYQLEAAAATVKQLSVVAASVAGREVPVGVNSWNLDPTQLATAHYADYFSNEVQHFNVEDLTPPFVYRLGTALDKPVFSTGTGEDWILAGEKDMPVRIKRWIATAYAHGHFFMYSWNKWGFSEETGTQWYQIPIEYYEQYCNFISENPELFDGFEPVETIAILYENEVIRNGNNEVKNICRDLNYANIPNGLAVSGDEWLVHPLTQKDLSDFDCLIIPTATNLSVNEKELLDEYAQDHKIVNWTTSEETVSKLPRLLKIENTDKVWALPRKKENKMVIHLLNQDYDEQLDKMNIKSGFQLFLDNQLTGNTDRTFTLYLPNEKPVKLNTQKVKNGTMATIPSLDLWGIVKVE